MRQVFPGVLPPSIDFQAVKDGRRSRPFYVTIDLTVARSILNGVTDDLTDASGKALILNAAGNSLFSDPIYDAAGNYIAGVIVAHHQDDALGSGISTPITLLPNSAERIPFTKIILENFPQVGKSARLVYGVDIDFVPGFNAQSTIAGTVNVDEVGQDAAVDAGIAFIGYVLSGASAANFSPCQLYNPAGSGKKVYLDSVRGAGPGANGSMQAYFANVALAVDAGACLNKDSGGAPSAAHVRKDNPAAVAGTIIGARRVTTNDGYEMTFDPPIKLGEGEGLTVAFNAINNVVDASFEFREKTS